MIEVVCYTCGKFFRRHFSHTAAYRGLKHDFCSVKCYDDYRCNNVVKTCPNCGRKFDVWKSHVNRRVYCSIKCKAEHWKKIGKFRGENSPNWEGGGKVFTCETCGKDFMVNSSQLRSHRGRFCSMKCYGIWREKSGICAGKRNPQWNGGTTSETRKRTNKTSWKRIADKVRERDSNICQHCGYVAEKEEKLSVHHKIPWRISRNDTFENLITLCQSCHVKEEKRLQVLYPNDCRECINVIDRR